MPDILKDVEFVHIFGFSFSEVDEDYVDWIYNNVPADTQWEISWYSDEDYKRISSFVMNYKGKKNRTRLIRLDDISENEVN